MKQIALLAAALATPAMAAAPFQNIQALQNRVVAALGADIGEPGGPAAPIDPRLKLTQCTNSVIIDPPAMGAIALRCPTAGWRIRVPLQRLQGAMGGNGAMIASAAPQRIEAVIRKGDPVDLVAGSDGFSVSVGATAQEDGIPGARIRVKTDGGAKPQGQIVFAEVIDAGRVRLPGFN